MLDILVFLCGAGIPLLLLAAFCLGSTYYRYIMVQQYATRHNMPYEQAERCIDSYIWEN